MLQSQIKVEVEYKKFGIKMEVKLYNLCI